MATKAVLGIMLLAAAFFAPPVERSFEQWRGYGGGPDSSQYSSLKQINKTNVTQLQVAWTYQAGGMTTNPMVVDGVMYVPQAAAAATATAPCRLAAIVALDGATGKLLWTSPGNTTSRGMNYWESKDRSDRRLVFINGGFIKEINARNGQTIATFGDMGRVDPSAESDRTVGRPSGNPGRIYKDTVIVSLPASGANYDSTPGDVRAYDVITGKLKWTFHSVPKADERVHCRRRNRRRVRSIWDRALRLLRW
jgi:quinoprotein glucose dehydrogenase